MAEDELYKTNSDIDGETFKSLKIIQALENVLDSSHHEKIHVYEFSSLNELLETDEAKEVLTDWINSKMEHSKIDDIE